MIDAPLALAFAAGLVATVNPCGFVMLPAYLSFFTGLGENGGGSTLARAVGVAGIISIAFLTVFGVAGVAITLSFQAMTAVLPWIALTVGVGVLVLGVAMAAGYEPVFRLPKAGTFRGGRGYGSVFGFGVSYAVASLSCTLPVFLTVIATQTTRTGLLGGLATFLAYGAGMAFVLIAVTVALASGKQAFVGKIRRSVRFSNRISAALLIAAGSYIVWFWGTNLASGASAVSENPAFGVFE